MHQCTLTWPYPALGQTLPCSSNSLRLLLVGMLGSRRKATHVVSYSRLTTSAICIGIHWPSSFCHTVEQWLESNAFLEYTLECECGLGRKGLMNHVPHLPAREPERTALSRSLFSMRDKPADVDNNNGSFVMLCICVTCIKSMYMCV